ncbi:glycogen/starch/alpha-glucan phosphorylase, partial [Mycobacterium tuberculosis]|nr:glycogen/starch/alpha-glucan phosphorylase [Mycobacterium tuberculosis]MBP0651204.1 glycogen/starch/alpha-glucan phosphorylase [Mycobacterium tuberculosis]
ARRHAGGHDPGSIIAQSHELSDVLEAISSGVFSLGSQDRYRGLVDDLRYHDWWMVVADFSDYQRAQREVDALWMEPDAWDRKAILNT